MRDGATGWRWVGVTGWVWGGLLVGLICGEEARAQNGPGTVPATTQAARRYERAAGIELARPGTLQQYIDRYSGEDVGCTIGGQMFRNFRLRTQSSVDESQLKGEHPLPPMSAGQILVTPVNYVKDGRRWVGFRWTTGADGWTVYGGEKSPPDYPYKKGHDIKNAGFTSNYEIRMEVHGTVPWERGKVAYAGLETDRLVDGQWSESANTGPGSRGNLGWSPKKIGAYGSFAGVNPKTPQSHAWARLSSVSKAFNVGSKAPTANDNWFVFVPEKAPRSFEARAGNWPDYEGEHAPHLYSYGMWFRMNCWGRTQTRWHADYVEFAFSNPALTDELWTADGSNKAAAPPPLPAPKQPLAAEDLPAPKPSGQTLSLDCGGGVELKLTQVPAGKFVMGSPNDEKGRCDNEGPQRVVTISKPFFLGIHEVTQAQFAAVMNGAAGSVHKGADRPVDNMHHRTTAETFCKKLSAKTGKTVRLPTEAEWEYAARAGSAAPYAFGADVKQLDEYGWSLANSGATGTQPVGQKQPNAWGLYDMHGNVWEWCSDQYFSDYVDAPSVDPNRQVGEVPVLRGGSWSYPPEYSRSASRLLGSPNDIADGGTAGFRIVVSDAEAESK